MSELAAIELYDGVDAITGHITLHPHQQGPDGKVKATLKAYIIERIQELPAADRLAFVREYLRQRYLRPVQQEMGYTEDQARACVEQLVFEGIVNASEVNDNGLV